MRKVVVSTYVTLDGVFEDSTLTKGNVAEEVLGLKQQPGQDLLMYSSVGLMHTLMQYGMIDAYRLCFHPVVLGSGKRLFPEGVGKTDLKLVDVTTFSTGVATLAYQPAGARG